VSKNIFKSLSTIGEVKDMAWSLMTRMVEDGHEQSGWFSMMAEELIKREQEIIAESRTKHLVSGRPKGRRNTIWTDEMVAELGKMTDRAFGKKWGIGHGCAYKKRRRLKIEPFDKARGNRRKTRGNRRKK
jgi:hypothetical protein